MAIPAMKPVYFYTVSVLFINIYICYLKSNKF